MNEDKEYDLLFNDISLNDKTVMMKAFHYFYLLNQKQFKLFLIYIFIIIETIQFISYAFTSPHHYSWKIDDDDIILISKIIGGFRLTSLIEMIDYKIYLFIFYSIIIIIFILYIILFFQILYGNQSSKLHQFLSKIINYSIELFDIILYFPLTEIILIPIKCVNGKVYGPKNSETCWESYHYLNIILGIIGAFLLFIWGIILLSFKFYPFQKIMSTTRIDSNNDIINKIAKLFIVLQNLLVSNEYISLSILLIISILLFYIYFNNQTYNNPALEIIITIKNLLLIWTYFILFVTKLYRMYSADGFIYILIFGFPFIIALSIVIYKNKVYEIPSFIKNKYDVNEYIQKAKFNIKLIDSFMERNRNIRNEEEEERDKNIIILKGNIKIHNKYCTNKDCPLTKFINNEGNFNIQKQCLLNYMNIFFNQGLKLFPKNFNLLILFIYFNYNKKFNLSSVKSNIIQLKKMKCNIKQKYILYCIEQNIKNMKNNVEININNDKDSESKASSMEQNYLKIKYYIETSIKLYDEFWGIFTTTVTNNINTNKLYSLGEKLNKYLNEIENIWENNLKNKSITSNYRSIVLLYCNFLNEILWDQKKSKKIYQKLNDDALNDYYGQSQDKNQESNGKKIDSLLNNQDFILYCDSDEKGNCKINQCSYSFCHYLGYQKFHIIGKPLVLIVPKVLIENFSSYVAESIKLLQNNQNNQNFLSINENESNGNEKIIVVKNRNGYIYPFTCTLTVSDDNDYSDSFLIKMKIEKKESKSEYSYNILTNKDFFIENISSSSIHLGIDIDLIKKYMVKMDILVRTDSDDMLDFSEQYNEFEEEQKEVIWIFPDIIYPRDYYGNFKEEELENLIRQSDKTKLKLQIKIVKFNSDENFYLFKLAEITRRNKKKNLKEEKYIPKCTKNLILFDLLSLNYIRSLIVGKRSEEAILRDNIKIDNENEEEEEGDLSPTKSKKQKKKKKYVKSIEEESSDNDDENEKKNLLTKEKVIELQMHNFEVIRNFIYSLPIYGSDVALERFRPNGEKYSASKITESLLKIKVSTFCKRLNEKYDIEKMIKEKKNKHIRAESNAPLASPVPSNTNDYLSSSDSLNSSTSNINSEAKKEDVNKGIATESSSTLSNIFTSYSIKYMGILMFVTFLLIIGCVSLEFIIIYRHMNSLRIKLHFYYSGHIIMSDLVYTKLFVTEGILAIALNKSNITYEPVIHKKGFEIFFEMIQTELAFYRQQFTETLDNFTSNEICEEFKQFLSKTPIAIHTLTLNRTEDITILLNSGLERISTNINNLAVQPILLVMSNRDSYELMLNLMNEYCIKWRNGLTILLNDCIKATKFSGPLIAILLIFFLVSIIICIIFAKYLMNFVIEREKPINLFLTLKKRVFESLKNGSENFSNKLLNKVMGNEEDDENSQKEYQSKIEPNDINIVKFKESNSKSSSFKNLFLFIDLISFVFSFLFIYIIYFLIKFLDFKKRMNHIFHFLTLFEKLNSSQENFILSVNIIKSYLYNKSIPILNNINTQNIFINSFYNITDNFEELVIYSSKSESFLSQESLEKYKGYLYGNICDIIDQGFVQRSIKTYRHTVEKGIISTISKAFDNLRQLTMKYYIFKEENNDNISFILKEEDSVLHMINIGIQSLIRNWFTAIIKLLIESFYDYKEKSNMFYIICFVCLIVLDILFYFFLWRYYQQKLYFVLKGSIDLINLIPQEIKNIIIENLNE